MKKLLKSFRYALRGIAYTFRHERNFQIECFVALVVFCLSLWFPLDTFERALLFLTVMLVLGMELVNTALERVMDILKPRVHPYAKVVKDVMAGAVLLLSSGAVFIGILIFLPYLLG